MMNDRIGSPGKQWSLVDGQAFPTTNANRPPKKPWPNPHHHSLKKNTNNNNNNKNNNKNPSKSPPSPTPPPSTHPPSQPGTPSSAPSAQQPPHPTPPTFTTQYTPPHGLLLLASTPCHPIAGTIAYRQYDARFPQPELEFSSSSKVVEVARLHVQPSLRGRGIATQLVRELVRFARADGVKVMYLHTHPFLPGAVALWEKEGWRVVCREEEGPWFTIHMRRDL
ncbi:hypothetical protein Q7P37_001248 [Cladosporium fusiforme]